MSMMTIYIPTASEYVVIKEGKTKAKVVRRVWTNGCDSAHELLKPDASKGEALFIKCGPPLEER